MGWRPSECAPPECASAGAEIRQTGERAALHARCQQVRRRESADRVAGSAEGVEFVDEPDGAAFLARGGTKRPEECTDLPLGRPLQSGLEGGRCCEEERYVRLFGDCFGQVGLSSTRRSFKKNSPARPPPHVAGEGAVGKEEVDGPDDLGLDDVDTDDVVEPDVDLFGTDDLVR